MVRSMTNIQQLPAAPTTSVVYSFLRGCVAARSDSDYGAVDQPADFIAGQADYLAGQRS
jgi:hypothetical protein